MTTVLVAPRTGVRAWAPGVVSGVLVAVLLGAAGAAGLGWTSALMAVWASVSVVVAIVDTQTGRLPDRLVLPGAVFVLLGSALAGNVGGALAGAMLFGLPLLTVHLARPDGMGYGDVKYAALLGAGIGVVGVPLVLPAYVLAAVLHVVVCLAIRAGRRLVPFGPSLALGSIVVVVIALVGR